MFKNSGQDALLAAFAAERAIRRLISSYCEAIRRRDADAAGALFAPDARVRIMDFPERVGELAILEGLRRTIAGFSFLHQQCDVGAIDVTEEGASARYGVIEANRPNGSDGVSIIFGVYDDEYKQVKGEWRFHRRRFYLQQRGMLSALDAHAVAKSTPDVAFARDVK